MEPSIKRIHTELSTGHTQATFTIRLLRGKSVLRLLWATADEDTASLVTCWYRSCSVPGGHVLPPTVLGVVLPSPSRCRLGSCLTERTQTSEPVVPGSHGKLPLTVSCASCLTCRGGGETAAGQTTEQSKLRGDQRKDPCWPKQEAPGCNGEAGLGGNGTASMNRLLRTNPGVAGSLVMAALEENESGQCRQERTGEPWPCEPGQVAGPVFGSGASVLSGNPG